MADATTPLMAAIDSNDPAQVRAEIARAGGAEAEVPGGTALGYAIARDRLAAVRTLLESGADPNRRDQDGDTAVTLAVQAYDRNPALLQMVLAAGGDPNTRRRDGNPVVMRFVADHDLSAIERMKAAGADLSVNERNGQPLIVTTAFANDWDVVLKMLELGVDPRRPDIREGFEFIFRDPRGPLPDSPMFRPKLAVWERLRAAGIVVPAPEGAAER